VRGFLFVKTKPGTERQVLGDFKALTEAREIHLITGKFDLFVALEFEGQGIDPRKEVVEFVIEEVRRPGRIVDTRTIMPIESTVRPPQPSDRPTAKGFVFIQTQTGRETELMGKLMAIPEVQGVHLLFGKSDLLAELEVEKSFVHPPPQRIAHIVEGNIVKLKGVRDTDTYVPLESIIK